MPGRVASIHRPAPVLTPSSRGGEAYALFQDQPKLVGMAVCEGTTPIGYVSRIAFLLRMADRFGRALFESRPIGHVMDANPFLVDEDMSIMDLGHRIVWERPNALEQGFIVTRGGAYVGIGSGLSLLGGMMAQKDRYADELKALAEQRAVAEREARQSADAKSAFLAAMSHEIRTPLNGILGIAHALSTTPLSDDQSRLVDTIRSSGHLLNRVLSDVLDLSRIEAAQTTIERAPQCPEALLQDVRALWTAKALEKGLQFEATFEGVSGRHVMVDGDRLRQVVFNLIGNAIKFCAEGVVRVQVRLDPKEPDHQLTISVQDTGIGIAPDAVASLFQPFVQADTSITRRFGGTGLGLAISSKLVALMDGTIDVESAPGMGSNFIVRLPVETLSLSPADTANQETGIEGVDEVDPGQWRVLVAEDNPVNRVVVTRLLEAVGCQVTTANDGAEALDIAAHASFDLILMDVQMPVMDGLAATRALRSLPGPTRDLPVVALTANVFAEDRQKCVEAGMDGFVAKPINPTNLLSAMVEAHAVRSAITRNRAGALAA